MRKKKLHFLSIALVVAIGIAAVLSFSGNWETAFAGDWYTGAKYTKIDAPIFNEDGTVNAAAVTELQSILDEVISGVGEKENYSCEDFGKYANGTMGTEDQQGIILVRMIPQNTEPSAVFIQSAGKMRFVA